MKILEIQTLSAPRGMTRAVGAMAVMMLALGTSVQADVAIYYWDANGATAGAGTTPNGTWGTDNFWTNGNQFGNVAGAAFASDKHVAFCAGTDATTFTVTLNTVVATRMIAFEEGTPTISGTGTITQGGYGIAVAPGVTATISTIIGGTNGLVLGGYGNYEEQGGGGTLVLNGSVVNTVTGVLTLNGGTLVEDYLNLGSTANLFNSGNALTLNGGNLVIKSAGVGNTCSQTLGNVTVNAGGGSILGNNNGSSANTTITLGTLTATAAGGSLLVGSAAADATNLTITTTSGTLVNEIYSGRVVYTSDNGTTVDWATRDSTASSPYTLAAFGSGGNFGTYTTMADTTGTDAVNAISGSLILTTGNQTHNSLKLTTGATLGLAANTLTLTSGGLLSTGTVASTISGNAGATRLQGSASGDLIIHQYNTGGLTISAVIGNNGGATALTKAGPGELILSGSNTYTGGTSLNAGTLSIGDNSALGTGALTIRGGTMQASGGARVLPTTTNTTFTADCAPTFAGANDLTIPGSGALPFNLAISNTGITTLKGGWGANIKEVFTMQAGSGNLIIQPADGTTTSNALSWSGGSSYFTGTYQVNNPSGTGGALVIAGRINPGNDNAAQYKTGNGTLILSGNSGTSKHGIWNVYAGVLNVRNSDALGTTTSGTVVNPLGAALGAAEAALEIQGNITIAAETLSLNGTGISSGGALRNRSGNNTWGGLITLAGIARINSDSGTLNISNTGTITGATFGLTVGGAGNTSIASIIGTTSGTLTKDGAGTLTLFGANTYTGATTISNGSLVARNASALGTGITANVAVAAGAGLTYQAAVDAPLSIGGTLEINGGANTAITGSLGSTATSAQIAVAGNVLVPTAAVTVNVFGIAGVTVPPGTTTYTLVSGGGGGATTLNNGTYTMGTVYNNANYTVGSITKSTTALMIDVTQQALLSGSVYWKGTSTTGLSKVWAASNGNTSTADSNWASSAGGTILAQVPGATADVIIPNSPTVVATGTTLGANMTIRTLTISDTTNGLGLDADGNTLTITPASPATGITMDAGVPASIIAANLNLGADQTWTNNSVNALTVSGIVSGTGALTKAGTGPITLSGANTFTGDTKVTVGTLTLANTLALQNSALDTTGAGVLDVTGYTTPTFGGLQGSVNLSTTIITGYGSIAALTLNPQTGKTPSYSGVIANGATGMTLTKTGAGTQILSSGVNTYTGATTVTAGTLSVATLANAASNSDLGAYASAGAAGLVLNGGTLKYTGSNMTSSINRGFTLNATSTIDVNPASTALMLGDYMINTYQLNVTGGSGSSLSLGAVTAGNGATYNPSIPLTLASVGNVANAVITFGGTQPITVTGNLGGTQYNRTYTVNGTLNVLGGIDSLSDGTSRTFTLGGTGTASVAGVVKDSTIGGKINSISKTGSGTWTFNGNNTYTGTTNVTVGKLFVNGNQSLSTGLVTVSGGATLGGTGTIGGNVTIAATGRLAFNLITAAPGTPLTLAATKSLTFSGASVLDITGGGSAAPGDYTLVTAPGGFVGVAPATVNLPAGWTANAPRFDGTSLKINITSTGATPLITLTGAPIIAVDTVYGTASAPPTSFTVVGSDLTPASGNLSLAALSGYEYCTTSGGTYASTLNLAYTSGTLASTPVYVRLSATASVASYSGNITVSGGGASKTIATVSSTVSKRALSVTANGQTKGQGQTVLFGSGSTLFTSSGLQNGEMIGTVTLACTGGAGGAAVGTYDITPSAATGGTFNLNNYEPTYNKGTLTVLELKEYAFGTTNPGALVLDGDGKIVTRGQAPIIKTTEGSAIIKLVYARLKNSGCDYSAEFSADLGKTAWLASGDPKLIYANDPFLEVKDNGDGMEVVSIEFPIFRREGEVAPYSYVKVEQNFCRISVTTP